MRVRAEYMQRATVLQCVEKDRVSFIRPRLGQSSGTLKKAIAPTTIAGTCHAHFFTGAGELHDTDCMHIMAYTHTVDDTVAERDNHRL